MTTKFKMAAPKVAAITKLGCLLDEMLSLKQSFLYYLIEQKIQFYWNRNQEMHLKTNQQSGSD